MGDNSDLKIVETDFLKLVRERSSVRKFESEPVEREKILTCIEAARLAPSAENVQPWRFTVLDDPEKISSFSESVFSGVYRFTRWAARAPVIVAIFARKDWLANRIGRQIQGTSYYLIDIGIAGEHLVLQAQELELGTCWIGWFHARKARRFLGAPKGWHAVALIAMGYPDQKRKKIKSAGSRIRQNGGEKRKKKSLEEIVSFNGFK